MLSQTRMKTKAVWNAGPGIKDLMYIYKTKVIQMQTLFYFHSKTNINVAPKYYQNIN